MVGKRRTYGQRRGTGSSEFREIAAGGTINYGNDKRENKKQTTPHFLN